MKYFLMVLTILTMASCMKSKEDYKQAITEIQEEESQEMQKEEADQRSRGSNDADGMGMDE